MRRRTDIRCRRSPGRRYDYPDSPAQPAVGILGVRPRSCRLRAWKRIKVTLCCGLPGPRCDIGTIAAVSKHPGSIGSNSSLWAWEPQPQGARRRAGICCVPAPRRCHHIACVAAPCICLPGARAKVLPLFFPRPSGSDTPGDRRRASRRQRFRDSGCMSGHAAPDDPGSDPVFPVERLS
jgi:hypothetical protein